MPEDERTISHYHLLSVLGRGGMGVVYKAEDTRLHRIVALKMLSETVCADAAAVARFRREAQAASALNHPSICTIYDVGEADGSAFIAMEYIEGTSLDAMIAAGPIASPRTVALAIDLADAVQAAHARGILHRDIKPSNIVVSARGTPKILDFGVALVGVEPAAAAEWATATKLTAAGQSVGTIAYMSPEQLRGEPLDQRSDLFSLGVVLYEMATGVHPFGDRTSGLVTDAILHRTPETPRQVNPAVPNALSEAIVKALEKDRELRYHSAAELRADLIRVQRGAEATHVVTATRPRTRRSVIIAALLVGAAAAAAPYLLRRGNTEAFADFTVTQVTSTGTASFAGVSPDGRFIAHVHQAEGQESLLLRNIPTGSDVVIAPPAPVLYDSVTFSRDGNYIYFRRTNGQTRNFLDLYRQPVLGGAPQLVVHDIDSNISFSPDGAQIAFARANYPASGRAAVLIAEADGSAQRTLLTVGVIGFYRSAPAWSPAGSTIALVEPFTGGALSRLYLADAHTGKVRRTLVSTNNMLLADPEWMPDGRSILVRYASKRGSLTQPQLGAFDADTGAFHPITNDPDRYIDARLSGDGRHLVAVQRKVSDRILVLPTDGGSLASATEALSTRQALSGFSWTSRAELLFAEANRVVARGLDGARRVVLTADPESPPAHVESCGPRDDILVVWPFRADAGTTEIWRYSADGSGGAKIADAKRQIGLICSPDGAWFAHAELGLQRTRVIGGAEELISGLPSFSDPGYSPDGASIAFVAGIRRPDVSGVQRKVVIFTEGHPEPRFLEMSQDFGGGPLAFTPDGAALAYTVRRKNGWNILVQPLDGAAPRLITSFDHIRIAGFRWSRDGQHLAVQKEEATSDVVLLTVNGRR